MPRTTIKHLLVVMIVGADQSTWTDASHDVLAVQHCCYWLNLEGKTAPTTPARPVVEVPLTNVFDSKALTGILDRIESGQPV